uniref:Mob1/phocein family protein n=1 Tax=Chrysotila carterae TaxID=13221 RepID=A0A7S4F664_CHRCT
MPCYLLRPSSPSLELPVAPAPPAPFSLYLPLLHFCRFAQIGVPFPPDFLDHVRNIFRRLFRIYAHIYYCHFERMSALGAEPHLNTCFKHYMYFVYEFQLIPKKEELAPLQELIDKLMERDAEMFKGSRASASNAAPDGFGPAAA